jgi:agmatinase
VAVVGVPFDSGTTFRPGARFGPIAVRQASRLLRPYHPALDVLPFETLQVADAGDITCNPFDIQESLAQIEAGVSALYGSSESFVAIGGDHTIALPLLRAVKKQKGARLALLHFDAHLDTFDTYFGAAYTHGTPFRRAFEEGLLLEDRSMHVGIRGPLYSSRDLTDDESFGFRIITAMDFETQTLAEIVDRVRTRIGDAPLYVSIDIDVLDPGAAPGTGTPEAGGLTSRELLGVLRGLRGLSLAAADLVEVAPAYDHAEVTAMAASHVVYELISLLALQRTGPRPSR